MGTMKLFPLGVIVITSSIMMFSLPVVVVDAFSGVMKLQTQTRSRQLRQQPSLSPSWYLMREGDDIDTFNDDSTMKTILSTTIIPTTISASTGTTSTITLHNYVDEKMIEDLQNQHIQMMQMQQQQQQQHQSYSAH